LLVANQGARSVASLNLKDRDHIDGHKKTFGTANVDELRACQDEFILTREKKSD
jgi:hypothetical protein